MSKDLSRGFSGETEALEFAVLHADDLLLDALGGRREAGAPGDPVVGLLRAFTAEVDDMPRSIAGLADPGRGWALASADDVPGFGAAPPVQLPTPRRARILLAPRAAAVVTIGAVVLGIGGVSAAVSGEGSPLQGIRRVVDTVAAQVTPERSDADKVSALLREADAALAVGDLGKARGLLVQARERLADVDDVVALGPLQQNLIQLQNRWNSALTEAQQIVAAPVVQKTDQSAPGRGRDTPPEVADEATQGPAVPTSPADVVPGDGTVGSPTDGLRDVPDRAVPDREELGETKAQLQEKVADLQPLPDLPGPIGERREPMQDPFFPLFSPLF